MSGIEETKKKKEERRVCRPHSPCKYSMNLQWKKNKPYRSIEANVLQSAKIIVVFFCYFSLNLLENTSAEKWWWNRKSRNKLQKLISCFCFGRIKSIKLEKHDSALLRVQGFVFHAQERNFLKINCLFIKSIRKAGKTLMAKLNL